jgi:hypothetical protein
MNAVDSDLVVSKSRRRQIEEIAMAKDKLLKK